jgi:hypothetical protein
VSSQFSSAEISHLKYKQEIMGARLPVVFLAIAAASLLPEHAEAATFLCNDPLVPCEQTFPSPCTDLLETGVVKTSDLLRDDDTEGGCILCVPPGRSYSGPNPCPNCFCDGGSGGSMACTGLAGTFISAEETSGACPFESQYADYTNFTVNEPACPTFELNCFPTCNGEPGVPCEIPFPSTCADLLATGTVTTNEVLRDDQRTGGCILCVPPNNFGSGPETCSTCECMGSEIDCIHGGHEDFCVGPDSGDCPPSEYADFTDFTVTFSPCKSIEELAAELDCADASNVPVVLPAPVDPKPAKGEKQKRESSEKTDKPDKADKPAKTNESVKPAKMQKGKKTKGDRF